MFVQIASSNFYDMLHPGDAVALESALYWALNSHGPRDREVDYEALDRGVAAQATLQADDIAAGVDIGFFNSWVEAPRDSPYWRSSDGDNRASTAASPVLLLGGWYDPFLPGMLEDFSRLRANAASAESRLIIGPYAHASDIDWPGAELKSPIDRRASHPRWRGTTTVCAARRWTRRACACS
jgi:predicted acyl esterase